MFRAYIASEFCVSKYQMNENQSLVKQSTTSQFWRDSLWFKDFMTYVNMFPHSQQVMIFMPLLCKLCGCSKMLHIFGSSWLVASEVRTIPLIHINMNSCLNFFFFLATTKCIIVISYSRMFILRRLLPWVVKVLCYLAVNQLCNSSEMFCILHWDNLEWSCCTLKCTWSCMNHKFSLVSNFNSDKWWKKLAMGQLHFGTFLHKWVVFWWESFSGIQYVWQIFESETIAFTPLLKWFHLFLYLKNFSIVWKLYSTQCTTETLCISL